jgi:hypothetical protein
MSTPPPNRVPTLTEVIDEATARPAPAVAGAPGERASPLDEEQLVQRILADVQRQVDGALEVRLREALTPALSRLTDALLRETRSELASSLRDIVARAVAQELSRHRAR